MPPELRQFVDAFRAAWHSPPRLELDEWADKHRVLSSEASAEPGRWRTDRVPYLREPMRCVSDPAVEQVVIVAASQSGKTEAVLNTLGYYMHQDPAPILCVEPRVEDCKALSKDRIAPMLRDSPALRGRVKDARSRDSGNTVQHKQFPGGHLTLAGANSAAGLSMRPIRVVLLDEVSRYPASAGTEGDPVTLAVKRTTTFWNRKIVMVSSPALEGSCRITAAYEETDQREYHLACPHCDAKCRCSTGRVWSGRRKRTSRRAGTCRIRRTTTVWSAANRGPMPSAGPPCPTASG
jgi:phage terminase large subunit GpA-like protein